MTFALFGQSLYFNFFIFDDAEIIYQNLKVAQASWSDVFNHWAISNTPIIYNVWQFVSMLFGVGDAFPFRFLNLFFHSINCFLVYLWCKMMLQAYFKSDAEVLKIESAALLGFLFYLLHPVHVEAVVWVTSLKEVLSTTFAMLSFLYYLKNNEVTKKFRFEVLTVVFYILGMLTHPTVAALPMVYIWLDFVLFNKSFKDIFYRNGIYFLLLVSGVVVHKTINPSDNLGLEDPLYLRVAVVFNAVFGYLQKAFFPWSYSFDYMMTPEEISRATQALVWPKLKAFLAAGFVWLLVVGYNKRRIHFLHYSMSLVVLLVSVNLGLVGYTFQNISTVADRFLYLPSIGISLFVGFILLAHGENSYLRKYGKVVMSSLLLIFFSMTVYRVHHWQSSVTLLDSSIRSGYESYPLTISLGASLLKEKEYGKALKKFEKAYAMTQQKDSAGKNKLDISSSESLSYIFKTLTEMGDKERGVKLFQQILSSHVEGFDPQSAWYIANYFISINRWYEAENLIDYLSSGYASSPKVKELKKEIQIIKQTAIFNSYLNLATYEIDLKNFILARKHLEKALDLKKKFNIHNDRVEILLNELTRSP